MKKNLVTILSTLVGVILLGVYILVVFLFPGGKKNEYRVLMLGDSIFGQYRDETGVAYYLEQELQERVFNGAFGGTPMARQNVEGKDSYYMDAFTFVDLAKALCYGDFGVQQTVRTKDYVTAHFPAVIDEMEKLDYSSIQTVLICYGLNDYMLGVPTDNGKDSDDATTFAGALRKGIGYLREKNPDVQIIVVSSPYSWFMNTGEDCEHNDYGGGYLEDYVAMQQLVAEELQVEFVDLYHEFYPRNVIEDAYLYTEDGMHPNEEMRQKLAHILAERIQ